MAFKIVQSFDFGNVQYSYDREGDVLYICFGPPKPAVALQVEDWLALRISLQPPFIAGMTIVGFKKIFEKVNRYIEEELPQRIQRLTDVSVTLSYDDQTDIFIMRFAEKKSMLKRIKELFIGSKQEASIFEPLVSNVYIEKSVPSKEMMGIKILEFTKCGPEAIEAFFGTIIDTIFEPHQQHDENAHLITNSIIQHLDLRKLSTLPA